ncbi:MAG: hypothetical protein ABL859_06460 [Methylotenera sp.]|nr:hypothetical protein [Methyloglobulus sp.]
MKHILLTATLLGLSAIGSAVYADVTLQSKDDVQGTWKLETTKNSLNDRRPFKREDTWVFKNGNLEILHIPREGTYFDQSPEPYEIENGKIKVLTVGSTRFEIYTVVDKDDKNMTLKGKFGTHYYFVKK